MLFEKKKILIVDDDNDTINILSYNFKKYGFTVFSEKDGLSGLLSINFVNPDIIILDIMMPFLNGIAMAEQLKKDTRYNRIPILFLSAASTKTVEEVAVKINEHYLCKPVPFNTLLKKVKKIMHW